MPILQAHIDELKRIHLRETGESLDDDEAREMANRLIALVRVILEHEYESNNKGSDLRPQVD